MSLLLRNDLRELRRFSLPGRPFLHLRFDVAVADERLCRWWSSAYGIWQPTSCPTHIDRWKWSDRIQPCDLLQLLFCQGSDRHPNSHGCGTQFVSPSDFRWRRQFFQPVRHRRPQAQQAPLQQMQMFGCRLNELYCLDSFKIQAGATSGSSREGGRQSQIVRVVWNGLVAMVLLLKFGLDSWFYTSIQQLRSQYVDLTRILHDPNHVSILLMGRARVWLFRTPTTKACTLKAGRTVELKWCEQQTTYNYNWLLVSGACISRSLLVVHRGFFVRNYVDNYVD